MDEIGRIEKRKKNVWMRNKLPFRAFSACSCIRSQILPIDSHHITNYIEKKQTEMNKQFNIWLKTEKLACEAQAKLGVIPNDVAEKLSGAIKFDVEHTSQTSQTHHNVW
ncbi:Asl protein [Dirofilaria immitis]|nr:Asl protein [Dirofilaria immitis]